MVSSGILGNEIDEICACERSRADPALDHHTNSPQAQVHHHDITNEFMHPEYEDGIDDTIVLFVEGSPPTTQ